MTCCHNAGILVGGTGRLAGCRALPGRAGQEGGGGGAPRGMRSRHKGGRSQYVLQYQASIQSKKVKSNDIRLSTHDSMHSSSTFRHQTRTHLHLSWMSPTQPMRVHGYSSALPSQPAEPAPSLPVSQADCQKGAPRCLRRGGYGGIPPSKIRLERAVCPLPKERARARVCACVCAFVLRTRTHTCT
jgi:hypothetical protein